MSDTNDNVLPDDVASELALASTPVDPGEEAASRMKQRLMDRVRSSTDEASTDLLTVSDGSGDWLETGPGNSIKILRSDDQSMSILVRLDAGATFPKHFHPADEETFVIEGETWFGDIHLKQGDYHLAPKGTTHGEVRTENGCVLLIRKGPD